VTWEETEAMLDEVKFNITVATMIQGNLEEAKKYIKVFGKETSSEDLREALDMLLGVIEENEKRRELGGEGGTVKEKNRLMLSILNE
jgi:VIT1/CCC1 family predicted Fe2+/Mn2+ transporter